MSHKDLLLEKKQAYYEHHNKNYTSNSQSSYNEEKFKINSYDAKRTPAEVKHPALSLLQVITVAAFIFLMFYLCKITIVEFLVTPLPLPEPDISNEMLAQKTITDAYIDFEVGDLNNAQAKFREVITLFPYHSTANVGYTKVLITQCNTHNLYCNEAMQFVHHCFFYKFISEEQMIQLLSEL